MRRIFLFILLASWMALPGMAQRRRPAKNAAKNAARSVAQVASPARQLYQTLLPATAKVMFIDSVVVGKHDFLSHVPLNSESGTLSIKSDRFGKAMMPLTQYENEFRDRRIYAAGDTTATALWTQTLLGDNWSKPSEIAEAAGSDYLWPDFPFLSSDGVTLYFSAKGPNSIGGRDIFMTTFDNDKGAWFEPQNLGLPFNSTANDYLLAIDDLDTLGWLVTDRHQHADSVCIYTFVPTATRLDFQSDDLTNDQLEPFAQLRDIRRTWAFGNRKAALRRLNDMKARSRATHQASTMHFVVNDRTIVTSPSQFKQAESRRLYAQLQEIEGMISQTTDALLDLRRTYADQPEQRKALAARIRQAESDLLQQQADHHMLEKKIRNLENH